MALPLMNTPPKEWTHNCGGSIVTEKHVITAAHCLSNYNPDQLSILAGTTKLDDNNGIRYSVGSFIIHPKYKELNTSDIGIMTIIGTFNYSQNVSIPIMSKSSYKIIKILYFRFNQ